MINCTYIIIQIEVVIYCEITIAGILISIFTWLLVYFFDGNAVKNQ